MDSLEWDFTTVRPKDRVKHPNRKHDARVREAHARIGKIIAAEFDRERKRLLAETLKKLAAEKLELVLMEQEEKRQAAIKADLEKSRKETQAYLERLMKAGK